MQRQCREPAWKFLTPVLFVAVAMAGGSLGCRKPKASIPPRPEPRWPGATIRIACAPGPARRVFEQHGRVWARDNGAKLELLAADDETADIVVFAPPDLAALVEAGRLRPLPDASETAAYLPMYRSRLLHWDGKAYALPLLGDWFVCVYRNDVFSDGQIKTAYRSKHNSELAPPVTWDEFVTQAAFFAAQRGKPSLPPIPKEDDRLDRLLGAVAAPFAVRAETGAQKSGTATNPNRLAAFSFQYDVETGLPRVASEGYVEALKQVLAMQPHFALTTDTVAALRGDQAVLGIVSLSELAELKGSGPWGIVRPPGSRRVFAPGTAPEGFVNLVPYVGLGGALAGVSTKSTCAEAAFDLLTDLSGEKTSLEIVHDPSFGAGPFRDSHLSKQASGWFAYGLDDASTLRLREVLREMADPRIDNPGISLRTPNQAAHRAALIAAVRKCLVDKSDPAAALSSVDRRWRELDGDPARARASLRKSLGL